MAANLSGMNTFYIPYVDKTMEKSALIKSIQKSLKEYVDYYSMKSITNPITKIDLVPRYDENSYMYNIAFIHFKFPHLILQSHINYHQYYNIDIAYSGYTATHIKILNARNPKNTRKAHYYQQKIERLEATNKALSDQLENYEDYCVVPNMSGDISNNEDISNIEVNAKGYPTTGQLRLP